MLPHLRGRPVTLERYPSGIGEAGLLAEGRRPRLSRRLERVEVPKKDGVVRHPLADDTRALLWMANQNAVTLHVWPSRVPTLLGAGPVPLLLDPAGDDPAAARAATLAVRDLLAELGLRSWVKTSGGSKGFHVAIPLDGTADFEAAAVRPSRWHAARAAQSRRAHPGIPEGRPRRGRVLVDTGRNGWSATFAAAYTVRASLGRPCRRPARGTKSSAARSRRGASRCVRCPAAGRRGRPVGRAAGRRPVAPGAGGAAVADLEPDAIRPRSHWTPPVLVIDYAATHDSCRTVVPRSSCVKQMWMSPCAGSTVGAICVSTLASAAPAAAQLNGSHSPGVFRVQSGSQPQPGFDAALFYLRYDTDTIKDADGNTVRIAANAPSSLAVSAGAPLLWYVSKAKVLGANYGAMAVLPFANASIEAPAFGLGSEGDTGVADMLIRPLDLGWRTKRADIVAGFQVYVPVGRYEPGGRRQPREGHVVLRAVRRDHGLLRREAHAQPRRHRLLGIPREQGGQRRQGRATAHRLRAAWASRSSEAASSSAPRITRSGSSPGTSWPNSSCPAGVRSRPTSRTSTRSSASAPTSRSRSRPSRSSSPS